MSHNDLTMILSYKTATLLALAALTVNSPGRAYAQDYAVPVRRIASSAVLAAQEYRLGVVDGKVVLTAEVEEAVLFFTEASRTALELPADVAEETRQTLAHLIHLVETTASPDSVSAGTARLVAGLGERFGVDVDAIPADPPSLAQGARVYQENCASCHGMVGGGDGPAGVGLDPPPSDLTATAELSGTSPLDFYRRITVGTAGTAMASFEGTLSPEDRWAAAVYATLLRLPARRGEVPPALQTFATTARMTDDDLRAALGPGADLGQIAAVRSVQAAPGNTAVVSAVFADVRRQVDSVAILARAAEREPARQAAFDAYLTFERVERTVRARDPGVASEAEAAFASLRELAVVGSTEEVTQARSTLLGVLERAERSLAGAPSRMSLVVQSFVILVREGVEAILIIGAIMAFLLRTGAEGRRRDINIGVGAAVVMSLLTALALETIFLISPAQQEALEGGTMLVATVMLFYVSYWLLSKMEIGKWNRFVRAQVQDAVTSGSALALASAAFLAVYREGFETVLFYKALLVSSGTGAWGPVLLGMAAAAVVLAVLYVAINRYGVRLPLKPFFGVTSAFLYYMAFVFAGKGIAELQEGGVVSTTVISAPRLPALGIFPTLESLGLQAVLVLLALLAVAWIFLVAPRRAAVLAGAPSAVPSRRSRRVPTGDQELSRSLDRIEADLAEIRAEVERIRARQQVEPMNSEQLTINNEQ